MRRPATELAAQLGARIRILVPQVVPYPLPIDRLALGVVLWSSALEIAGPAPD